MVGSATLDFLTDFCCRHASSLEGALLILQLAHFKHFDEPLTVFVRDELLGTSSPQLASEKLSDPKGSAFFTSLKNPSFQDNANEAIHRFVKASGVSQASFSAVS